MRYTGPLPQASAPHPPTHPSVDPPVGLREILHLARLLHRSGWRSNPESGRPDCPRCHSAKVHRWGSFSGRQRYRCHRCRRSFSDFTATPFWHSRKVGSWLTYLDWMAEGASLRTAARVSGVSLSTAFRRRHHILAWSARIGRPCPLLRGSVGLEELRIPESFKGSRKLPRPSRSHALPWGERTVNGRRSLVLVFHAVQAGRAPWPLSRGHVASCGVFDHRPDPAEIGDALGRVIHSGSVITAPTRRGWKGWPGQAGPIGTRAARAAPGAAAWPLLKCEVAREAGVDPTLRMAALGARKLRRRLRGWLPRFRSVATRHLPSYLVWFSALSRAFPDQGQTGARLPCSGPEHFKGVSRGGLRLLAALLTPPEADP